MLNNINAYLLGPLIALSILIMIEVGYRVGRRWPRADEGAFGVVSGGAFALVALLLAFSFSIAVERFNERRLIVIHEADAITTLAANLDFLDRAATARIGDKLREYVRIRFAFASTSREGERAAIAAQSDRLSKNLWRLVSSAAESSSQPRLAALTVSSLHDVIKTADEQSDTLMTRLPGEIVLILIGIVLLAGVLLGLGIVSRGRRDLAASVLFALMLAAVVSTIADVNAPQQGLIKVDLAPLRQAEAHLNT